MSSESEKSPKVGHFAHSIELPRDPDAHLSEAEREAIVRWINQMGLEVVLTRSQERKLIRKLDIKLIPWVRQVKSEYIKMVTEADACHSYVFSTCWLSWIGRTSETRRSPI
jgi:hypothetical protein